MACRELEMQMTRAAYAQWIKRLELVEVTRAVSAGENGARRAVFECADEYVQGWCEHRLGARIREALAGALAAPAEELEVRYEVREARGASLL